MDFAAEMGSFKEVQDQILVETALGAGVKHVQLEARVMEVPRQVVNSLSAGHDVQRKC